MDKLTVVNTLLPKDENLETKDINAKFQALISEKFIVTVRIGNRNIPSKIAGVTMQVATPNTDVNLQVQNVYRDITTSNTLYKMGMEATEAYRQTIYLSIMDFMINDSQFLELMVNPYHAEHSQMRNPNHPRHCGWSKPFVYKNLIMEPRFFPTTLINQDHRAYHKATLFVKEDVKFAVLQLPVDNSFKARWFFTNEDGYKVNIVTKV